jgi:putative ABC transport system permease protein
MIKNYLLITLRNFLRNKVHTSINIIGLTIGIASSSLIFLYVFDELSYDTIHPKSDELYSLGVFVYDKNGNKETFGVVPGGWAGTLKSKFENIEDVTKISINGFPHSIHDKEADKIILNQDGELYWVENSLNRILYFPLLQGNTEKALEHVNSMVISESASKALFGDNSPLDRIVTIKHPFSTLGKEVDYVISGIFKDYPSNTFFRPKYLLNVHGLKTVYEREGRNFDEFINGNNFNGGFFFTFLRMPGNPDLSPVREELKRLADVATRSDSAFFASGSRLEPVVKPFTEMHFDSGFNWSVFEQQGDIQTVIVLAGVGLLILLIASINYMNLATARSSTRGKEVGLRKTLGSRRRDIAIQFIQESAITTFIAFILAVVLIFIALPYFNQLSNKHFGFSALLNPYFLLALLAIIIAVTVLGGSYPAFYLSSFKPAAVLKGGIARGKNSDVLRKTLVTFQFASAVLLTISTLVILRQMDLIQKSKLNESGEQILSVRYGTVAPNEKYEALKNELLKDKDLNGVTMANHLPRHDYFGGMETNFRINEVDDKEYTWSILSLDFDFTKAFDIQMVAGRDFDSNIPSDSNTVLINEKAVKILNRTNADILGMQIENSFSKRRSTIIGVVKDFPFQSAYHTINPLVLSPHLSQRDRILYIKLPGKLVGEKIKFIEDTWKKVMPGVGFDYWFISDEFGRLYKKERQISSMAKLFAMLALCITILGLYGLASYMAEQSTKEVGIRKALGATVAQVVFQFMSTFLKMFGISLLIALPAAWYFSDQWLSTFVDRITIGPELFITSAGFILILMVATVIYEVVTAARANPIKALRHE